MRQEKQLLLDEIKGQMDKHGTFVIMSYQKVKANLANKFRNEIAKLGGNVEVVRKRLLIKAADAAGLKLDLKGLPGHIGLVLAGKDPIETTKAVFRFSQDNDKALEVLGGRFEGLYYDGKQVEMLSKLPGKDEMRAQLLGVLEAPMSQTLAVMEALLSSVVYCLDNKTKEANK
ncbi:MAG: 50S ribosomal protein L10 [Parachlamydia sp.]|nr:50S ribosomal protein L10 [Parachlamydia sp.]